MFNRKIHIVGGMNYNLSNVISKEVWASSDAYSWELVTDLSGLLKPNTDIKFVNVQQIKDSRSANNEFGNTKINF